jgi:hypothetical protein
MTLLRFAFLSTRSGSDRTGWALVAIKRRDYSGSSGDPPPPPLLPPLVHCFNLMVSRRSGQLKVATYMAIAVDA